MSSEPTSSQKQSRAGRNLPAAIAVGVGLVAVIALSLYFYRVLFALLVLIIMLLGIFEFARALKNMNIKVPLVPVVAGGVAVMVGAYIGGPDTISVGVALSVLGIFILRFLDGFEGFVRDVAAGVLTLIYLPVLGSFVLLMVVEVDGVARIITFIAVTALSDIGGYAVGVWLGKHPMAPSISPKKSWEGFAGSFVFGVATAIGLVVFLFEESWWIGLLLGVAIVVFAVLGDLTESLIKRDLGIKDMGSLLPGHGGIMDRVDALLVVAPVAWLIMHVFLPVS